MLVFWATEFIVFCCSGLSQDSKAVFLQRLGHRCHLASTRLSSLSEILHGLLKLMCKESGWSHHTRETMRRDPWSQRTRLEESRLLWPHGFEDSNSPRPGHVSKWAFRCFQSWPSSLPIWHQMEQRGHIPIELYPNFRAISKINAVDVLSHKHRTGLLHSNK